MNGWAKGIEGVVGEDLIQETVMNRNGSNSHLGFSLFAAKVPSRTRLLVDEEGRDDDDDDDDGLVTFEREQMSNIEFDH
jgi:hypothetical protein